MEYEVILEKAAEGGYIAEVPQLPGCISEGDTKEEAIENIKEAIIGYLKALKDEKEEDPAIIGHPQMITVSV